MLYLFLSCILHSLRINEAGLVVHAGQLGHELSFNAVITVDSVVTSIMKCGAFNAAAVSIAEFRYNTVMIKFSCYYMPFNVGIKVDSVVTSLLPFCSRRH